MPYARKRSRKRTFRRYTRRFRARRKALYKTRRFRRPAKRRKLSTKRVVGPFASFGNKYVRSAVTVPMRFVDQQLGDVMFCPGEWTMYRTTIVKRPQEYVWNGNSIDCCSPTFYQPKEDWGTYSNADAITRAPQRWDLMATKYTRAYVKKVNVSVTFNLPTSGQYLRSGSLIVGLYMTRQNTLRYPWIDPNIAPPLELPPNPASWPLLKRSGNVKYKVVSGNTTRVTVSAMVDVGTCLQSKMEDRWTSCYPLAHFDSETRVRDGFPRDDRLYVTPFFVPMVPSTFDDDPTTLGTTRTQISYRTNVTKWVHFDRANADVTQTRLFNDYPAIESGFSFNYRPFPLDPPFTDPSDEKNFEQDQRLEDLENGQGTQDDQAQFFFNTNADSIAEVADDLAAHEALEGKQAH